MDYICYRRKLGEVEVRKFIRQIVSAVHYLHQGGILHRFERKIYLTFWSHLIPQIYLVFTDWIGKLFLNPIPANFF